MFKKKIDRWVLAGMITVDAGLCWVGDPCYFADGRPKEFGNSWSGNTTFPPKSSVPDIPGPNFCDNLEGKDREGIGTAQWNHDNGGPGLGVTVTTGYGDGCYPVYVRINKDGVIVEMRTVFAGLLGNKSVYE